MVRPSPSPSDRGKKRLAPALGARSLNENRWCTLPGEGQRRLSPGVHIRNLSRYRDEDVATFVRRGLRAYGVTGPVEVVVRPATGRTRGCARLGGHAMVLAVARPSKWSQRKAALILRHEAAHLHGADHHEMSEDIHWSRGPMPAWCQNLPMRRKALKTK